MSKKIIIENCMNCHHRGHRGGYGQVAYIPTCNNVSGRKTLPYTESAQGGRVVATPTGDIPEWCPLEEDDG